MCGIFGIYSKTPNNDTISNVIECLKLLQHRGKDGCGISYLTADLQLKVFKVLGKVKEGFKFIAYGVDMLFLATQSERGMNDIKRILSYEGESL